MDSPTNQPGLGATPGQYEQAPQGYPSAGGYGAMPSDGQQMGMPPSGPIGQQRSTGMCILLYIVTLGIYGLVWWYKTHEEMKRHTGEGLGGGVALIIGFFVSPVMGFLTPGEVARLYERRGQQPPVTVMTGLWFFPGCFIIIGPLVWFVKTNGALNDYWASLGAPAA